MNPRIQAIYESTRTPEGLASQRVTGSGDLLLGSEVNNFAQKLITDLAKEVQEANLNRCACTTFDSSLVECARQELLKHLAETYDLPPPNFKDHKLADSFPVKSYNKL